MRADSKIAYRVFDEASKCDAAKKIQNNAVKMPPKKENPKETDKEALQITTNCHLDTDNQEKHYRAGLLYTERGFVTDSKTAGRPGGRNSEWLKALKT